MSSFQVSHEEFKGKRVLVTGAGGFIGSHLVETLVSLGAKVTAFLRYTSRADIGALSEVGNRVIDEVELMFGDLRDPEAMREAVRDKEYVFHLGAVISVPYSFVHPVEVVETNISGTLNVLNAAKETKPISIVHLSTSEVYGTARYTPIDEFHPKRAQSPYAASKIGADEIARSFHLAYNLPVVIVRPFNTFGPRQSQRAVITTITVQALKNEKIKLGYVESVRDFVFVKDTVMGLCLAALSDDAHGEELNLATGRGHRIRDVAERVLDILGVQRDIEIEESRMRPGKSEVLKLVGSNERAKQIIGWEPQTSFEEGLEITVKWIRDHLDFYKREIL